MKSQPRYSTAQSILPAGITPDMLQSALRVCLVVGTLLFCINHGSALAQGEMQRTRWISAVLTYCVPFSVSLHGQVTSRKRLSSTAEAKV